MTLSTAPLFTEHHPGPPGGVAYWATTSDGLRIRLGHWNAEGSKGTVLMFPGRTEYIEKYATTASELAARGYATLTIDWRGQGLADRMLDDVRIGHVIRFADYQSDVTAMLEAADTLKLPKPYFLLAHSMGGAIGLRSLYQGLPVQAAAFTGPMWGIRIAPHLRPLAWSLGQVLPAVGQGHRLPPGTTLSSYVLSDPFEDNMLTTDREMWDMMVNQLNAHPELCLGGPSITWLREALADTAALARKPAPNVPCLTFLGTNERIVHIDRIHARMRGWNDAALELVEGCEHEVLMEGPAVRGPIFDAIAAKFAAAIA